MSVGEGLDQRPATSPLAAWLCLAFWCLPPSSGLVGALRPLSHALAASATAAHALFVPAPGRMQLAAYSCPFVFERFDVSLAARALRAERHRGFVCVCVVCVWYCVCDCVWERGEGGRRAGACTSGSCLRACVKMMAASTQIIISGKFYYCLMLWNADRHARRL